MVEKKEANQYIANVSEKFGSYRLVDDKIAFNPALYDENLSKCIPGLADYRQKNATLDDTRMEFVDVDHVKEPEYDSNDDTDEDMDGIIGNWSGFDAGSNQNAENDEDNITEDLEFDSLTENHSIEASSVMAATSGMQLVLSLPRIDVESNNIAKNVGNGQMEQMDADEEVLGSGLSEKHDTVVGGDDKKDDDQSDHETKNVENGQTSVADDSGDGIEAIKVIESIENATNKRSHTFDDDRASKKVRFSERCYLYDGLDNEPSTSDISDVDSDDSNIGSQGNASVPPKPSTVAQLVAELVEKQLKSSNLKAALEHLCTENVSQLFNETKKLKRQLANMKRALNNAAQRYETLEENYDSLRKEKEMLEKKLEI